MLSTSKILRSVRKFTLVTMKFTYPTARRDESVVEDYHGTKIADPYRWLEDPDAEETKAFVTAQNAITDPYLESCSIRETLRKRITEMWDYPKYGCPRRHGDKYFYYYNTGLQNQSVLYVQNSLKDDSRVFLDPNALSADGTVAINGQAYSEDGSIMAYKLSEAGSDWNTIKFRSCDDSTDLADVLEKVKFSSLAWTHDHKGVFYNSYPHQASGKSDGTETTANKNQKLYYHKLGMQQSEDVLCGEWPEDPNWMGGAEVSDCGRYVVLVIRKDCAPVNKLYYCDLHALESGITGKLPWVSVVDNFDSEYEYITNEGTVFTFKTNCDAPKYKIINIDISKPDKANWTTLVPESEDVLEWCACVDNDKLILCYMKDVKNTLSVHSLSDGSHINDLPLDIGSVVGFSGKKKYAEIFYLFKSFLSPGIIYRYDFSAEQPAPTVFRETELSGFVPNDYITKQVFYPSKDGTKIPMFIVHKKDIELDSSHPVLLYGYGGFNISLTPTFSPSRLVFLGDLGGILAVPNLRGGGEYGEKWHKAGTHGNKQNVFDDCHAAAEYLVQEKYTTHQRIAINGGSNGGLLVGACVNQRPELYGCGIAQVPVMDMLRFHKFTIGHAWTSDFGCADNKEDFDYLIKYSPLHTTRSDVLYPAVLLVTADHDDRVVPLHSLKYIAQLQHDRNTEQQINPLMIKVDTKAGHGAGKPVAKVIDEVCDVYSFMTLSLGLEWKEPTPQAKV